MVQRERALVARWCYLLAHSVTIVSGLAKDMVAVEDAKRLLDTLGQPGKHAERLDFPNLLDSLLKQGTSVAKGTLAQLYLLGVPGDDGHSTLPNGFPRDLKSAVDFAVEGAEAGDCGRCFFILGALLAIGDPIVSRSLRFRVSEEGQVKFQWIRGIKLATSAQGVDPTLDRPALAYYVSAELGDPLGRLAFAHYAATGLTLGHRDAAWWKGNDTEMAVPALPREPRSALSLDMCGRALRALAPLAEEAALNEVNGFDAVGDLNFRVETADEVYKAKKEHADWVIARAHDRRLPDQVAQAGYHLHGDADIGVPKDEEKAKQLFDSASRAGSDEAAWTAMLLHARDGRILELTRCVRQLVGSSNATQVRKVMAQYYMHSYGIDVKQDPRRAGAYLLLAADLGDANAQQTLAHGYAGVALPDLQNVSIPGAPNDARALHYYSLAAQQGRPVSAVNAGALLAQGRGGSGMSTQASCQAAYRAFHQVSLAYHPDVLRMHAHARRSFRVGDEDGALLHFALLSELGAQTAHTNAAFLWSKREEERQPHCWRASNRTNSRECELDYRRRAATLSGDVKAMMDLSAAYASNDEHTAAFLWASRAAAAGDARGVFATAYGLENGIGTEKDAVTACATYCALANNVAEPAFARMFSMARALRLRVSIGTDCCAAPVVDGGMVSLAAIGSLCFGVAAASSIASRWL